MEITTPTLLSSNVKKTDIFESYKLWKSLPSFFKYPPKDKKTGFKPSPREYCEMMGIDDEVILELSEIKTNTQFAERFGVAKETLSDWNKIYNTDPSINDLRLWAKELSKNVLAALYNNAIRSGMAHEVKLWFQLVNEWQEKAQVEHKFTPINDIEHDVIDTEKTVEVDKDEETTRGV